MVNEFSKNTGFKDNIQKSLVFLHASNNEEIKQKDANNSSIKNHKMPENKSTGDEQGLCTEKYQTLVKERKEALN